jgi:hypothetical protein
MTSKFTEASFDTTSNQTLNYRDPPPTYHSQPSSTPTPSPDLRLPPQVFGVDFLAYRLPNSIVSSDRVTRQVSISPSQWNTSSLTELISQQANLPPQPLIKIRGTHIDKLYSWGTTKTDFDLTLDLTALYMGHTSIQLSQQPQFNSHQSIESSIQDWAASLRPESVSRYRPLIPHTSVLYAPIFLLRLHHLTQLASHSLAPPPA